MFTGIVAELGKVESVDSGNQGSRLRIATGLASELGQGDSVAVNGACLTATTVADGAFEADVMQQTLGLTTLGELAEGDAVNLELALRADDRLGGHVVQGHVDGTAELVSATDEGFARRLRFRLPADLLPLVVERGSIAIQGVSLTIAGLAPTDDEGGDWIEVSLVSETLERTTLGALEPGDPVNVECDVLARYVQRLLPSVSPSTKGAIG